MDLNQPSDHRLYRPEIRFSDIDAAGIVNNAVFFSYFEQSRIKYFGGLVGRDWDWHSAGMVVASHRIDYLHPLPFGARVMIHTWLVDVGTKKMVMAYEVMLEQETERRLAARAETTLVCFDHSQGVSIPIPNAWRPAMDREMRKPSPFATSR